MFNKIINTVLIFVSLTLIPSIPDMNHYYFNGTSNNWDIVYNTKVSEGESWAEFSFEYIGEDDAPSQFKYNLKSDWFELISIDEKFNHPSKNINSGNSGCAGPPINPESCNEYIKKDTQIEAIIEWDGKSETIFLKQK